MQVSELADRYRAALELLASGEAFTCPGFLDPSHPATQEFLARRRFAQRVLDTTEAVADVAHRIRERHSEELADALKRTLQELESRKPSVSGESRS